MFLEQNKTRIEELFAGFCQEFPKLARPVLEKLQEQDEDTALALKYLYAVMPCSDAGNYPFEIFLDYARHGVYLWNNSPYVKEMPEDIFLNYVLYHRINEEEIDVCRSLFYSQLKDRVEGLSMKEAALEVNYWSGEEATYTCTDDRTAAPLNVYRCAFGRCGEESTFTVSALRSAGLPARQVYAPKWSHCDDNHAWAEVWCDGTWYFLGACEPEPILNKGWFTNASSRAMMVHSRCFDGDIAQGEKIGQEGMVTMLNELKRYAETKEIAAVVKDQDGNPVSGVEVFFEVLNYAEFAPIAEGVTDKEGKVTLTTGLGSLHIHVKSGDTFAEGVLDTREASEAVITLAPKEVEEGWTDFDMIAPVDKPINADMPTKEQKEAGDKRVAQGSAKRIEKAKNAVNEDRIKFLEADGETRELRQKLLDVLTEKDQHDCKADVLEEHLQQALMFRERVDEDTFVKYIVNPRVHDEVLTKYRLFISQYFNQEEIYLFYKKPVEIWKYIEKNIVSRPEKERTSLLTTPAACLKYGVGSELSKKILFVAIARTIGLPARLNPADGAMEYWKKGGFVPVLEEAARTAKLRLTQGDTDTVWTYFQNWSMAKCVKGRYQSLKLADAQWENGTLTVDLEPGQYRILTANRLPNGNIFAKAYVFGIQAGEEKEIAMSLREANLADMLENIAIRPFTLKDGEGREVEAADITREGKTLMIFLEESREPTEHILNELMERQEEFRKCDGRIVFVIRTKEALKDPRISQCLKALPDTEIYYDSFEEIIEVLGRRMYVDPEKLPLILVFNGELNGIYATSGYNVGTGDMLLRLL